MRCENSDDFLFECVYGVIRWSCGVEETIRFCTDGAQFICRLNGGRRDDGDKRQDFKLNVFHCRRPEFATKKNNTNKAKGVGVWTQFKLGQTILGAGEANLIVSFFRSTFGRID